MLYARPLFFLSELTNGVMLLGQRTLLFFCSFLLQVKPFIIVPLRYCR